MTRDEWLHALPRPERHEYTRCPIDDLCERCMALWLDRPAPRCCMTCGAIDSEPCDVGCECRAVAPAAKWRHWYDGDTYLGLRSARTGPDAVVSAQRCECEVCRDKTNT